MSGTSWLRITDFPFRTTLRKQRRRTPGRIIWEDLCMTGMRLKPCLSLWRRWQKFTSTKILNPGYLGGKYHRKYEISTQNTTVCSCKRSLKYKDNDHSDFENFILNLIYKWHMSVRWCTPDLHLVTNVPPWHQVLCLSVEELSIKCV